jgi:hypothetical protein
MISDALTRMADHLAGYALHGRAVEPEHAACIARELMDHARTVAVLETLPFDLTTALLDAIEVISL